MPRNSRGMCLDLIWRSFSASRSARLPYGFVVVLCVAPSVIGDGGASARRRSACQRARSNGTSVRMT
jgi:hypothetical protein